MRIIKNPELKGIFALTGIAAVLAVVLLILTGVIVIRTPWSKRLTDKMVFVTNRDGHPNIWVMNPDGSGQKPLTKDQYSDTNPVVSPDGYSIAFLSKRDTPQNQVYLMDADGSHQHRITNITGAKSGLRFNADGTRLMFVCSGEIWSTSLKGEQIERLLPTEQESTMGRLDNEKSPYQWAEESPAGGVLAAVHSMGEAQIVVWLKPGKDAPVPLMHQLNGNAMPLAGESVNAAWDTKGEMLAVSMNSPKGDGVLVLANPTDDTIQPIIQGGSLGTPAWSPDGKTIALQVTKRVGPGEFDPVALLMLESSSEKPKLIKQPAVDLAWAPDGKSLVFTAGNDIFRLDPATGKTTNLTKGKGVNSSPSWAPLAK